MIRSPWQSACPCVRVVVWRGCGQGGCGPTQQSHVGEVTSERWRLHHREPQSPCVLFESPLPTCAHPHHVHRRSHVWEGLLKFLTPTIDAFIDNAVDWGLDAMWCPWLQHNYVRTWSRCVPRGYPEQPLSCARHIEPTFVRCAFLLLTPKNLTLNRQKRYEYNKWYRLQRPTIPLKRFVSCMRVAYLFFITD